MLDQFDDCFLKVTPPKNSSFSHRRRPCRYEPAIAPSGKQGSCPFRDYCARVKETPLSDRLRQAYSEPIKNTLSEPSTSVVVRSEQQFHGMDRQRYAQRRHLYEVVRTGTPDDLSRYGTHCTPLDKDDRFGEYLGFVDLRQHFEVSPLALGLLVQPGCIREDPCAYVIQGEYGPLFGAHSFRSTVYAMQDQSPTIGAKCAQMCAIMALGMLGDRRADIKGSFTLTFLSSLLQQNGNTALSSVKRVEEAMKRLDDGEQDTPLWSFSPTGLDPVQLRDVLNCCAVRATWIDLEHQEPVMRGDPLPVSYRLALRIIEAYIYARFPVILSVDSHAWKDGKPASEREPRKSHAVTIIGARRSSPSGEISRIIVHDPGWKPFGEMTAERTFFAAREYATRSTNKKPGVPRNRISMVPVTTCNIKRHPNECVTWLLEDAFELVDFRPYYLGMAATNYDIRLLNRNSLLHVLAPRQANEIASKMLARTLPESTFWTISAYRDGKRTYAWLFDAESQSGGDADAPSGRDAGPPPEGYALKLTWGEGSISARKPRNGKVFIVPLGEE